MSEGDICTKRSPKASVSIFSTFVCISGGSVLLAIVLCFFGPAGNDMLDYPTILRKSWILFTMCEICYTITGNQ